MQITPASNGLELPPTLYDGLIDLSGTPTTAYVVDQATKALLDDVGVEYTEVNLKMSAIDKKRSLANQARQFSLDDETVLTYAEAMSYGDVFPRVIAIDEGRAFVVLAAGNHRHAAAEMVGATEIRSFLVKSPTPAQLMRILYEDNLRHGRASTRQERLDHARSLVMELGLTQQAAAQMMRLKASSLSNHMTMRATEDRLVALRLPVPKTATLKVDLHRIKSDNVLRSACKAISYVSGPDMAKLITESNRKTTEADQAAVFDNIVEENKRQVRSTGGVAQKSPYQKAMLALGAISRLPADDMLASLPGDKQASLHEKAAAVVNRLDGLLAALAVKA